MAYFADQYGKLSFPVGKSGFRDSQLAAIQSVGAHFFNSNVPAIVVMPTGSGKSAVALALAFVLRAGRVLILTPSRLLREQMAEKFATLADLQKIRALPIMMPPPKVKALKGRVASPKEWAALKKFDVVVTTVNSVSAIKNPIPDVPPDLFDLVIVDEGHHAPAATWSRVLQKLEGSRQILLTATPFRRDAKEIRGKIVFVYDVRRAFEDKIFGDLTFQPAEPESGQTSDQAIAAAAAQKFKDDRAEGWAHLLMVRVDSIARGRELEKVYASTDLRLRFISGASALSTVKKTVEDLKAGLLDGIICVNMFGEGFDLPRLKIAALHSPHRSLAVTLQFIGRFARTNDPKIGRATFIAYPEEQRNELQDLWTSGAPWPDFIQNLSAARVEAEARTREVLESFSIDSVPELADISLTSIQPYHHVKIYRCPDGVDLDAGLFDESDEIVVFRGKSAASGAVVYITKRPIKPRWTTDRRIQDIKYDVDIFHFNEQHGLLFICSSRKTADHYKNASIALSKGRTLILSAATMNRAHNDIEGMQFFNLGMRKRQFGGRNESYRILAGPSADGGVGEMEGQMFDRGHSFGKGREAGRDVTIGISTSSKAWSNTVDMIPNLISWCDTLADKIGSGVAKPTGSGIDFLSAGEPLHQIEEAVVFGVLGQKAYVDSPGVFVGPPAAPQQRGVLAEFELQIIDSGKHSIHFRIASHSYTWDGLYSLKQMPLIAAYDESEEEPRVGGRHGDVSISDYLTDNPPRFFTESMSAIEGASLFPPPTTSASLDQDDFECVDWATECVNIEMEKPDGVETKSMSIFSWLDARLRASSADFVFNDDGAGEIADFVTAEDSSSDPKITFYHCKASGKAAAGARVQDLYEVCGQAIKCGIWIAGSRLIDRVEYRVKARGIGGIRKGKVALLRRAFAPERRQKVKFRLVIVQPGVSAKRLREGPHQLLVAAKHFAKAAAFDEFKVIASA